MVKNVASADEYKEALVSTPIVVADFYAHWCGPCVMLAPMLEELETTLNATGSEHANKVSFAKVNVDKLTDLSAEMGISAMPTLIIYMNGKVEKTIVGANFPLLSTTVSSLLVQLKESGGVVAPPPAGQPDAVPTEDASAAAAEEEVVESV